jgi:predicted nucleic acid-binding protein
MLLLDSNILIAALAAPHHHHEETAAFLKTGLNLSCAVADHSVAEAYSNLTRMGGGGFGFPSHLAIQGLNDFLSSVTLLSLNAAQTLGAIEEFALSGGVGPRLYDKLIGQVAVINAIPTIITLNLRHMTSLFPTLRVITPSQFTEET